MPEGGATPYEMALTHFIVSDDVEPAARFYTEVLGGTLIRSGGAVYAEWSGRGAEFLTPPKGHQTEIRCYVRHRDGHVIEVGQTTLPGGWRQFLTQNGDGRPISVTALPAGDSLEPSLGLVAGRYRSHSPP